MTLREIYEHLLREIKNPYAVCGLMGNIKAESNFKPNNLQNSCEKRIGLNDVEYTKAVDNGTYQNFTRDSAGYGICQWTYWSRKADLLNYAKTHNRSIGDISMQLDFLIYELRIKYYGLWNDLVNAKDIKTASDIILLKYERPSNQSAENCQRRANMGIEIYKALFDNENQNEERNRMEVTNMGLMVYSKKKDGSKKLTANFTVKEFACKDGSDPIFIDQKLIVILQEIRDHFGKPVNINSSYRTVTYNKRVGGATYSQHQYGTAADIRISGVTPTQVANFAEQLLPNTGGIGIYSSFTHIDTRETKSRWRG